jgi:hypothetical protein
MSLPDRNIPWPEMVTYFKNNKKDDENLGVVLKRASHYRKTGKVLENIKMHTRTTAKKRGKKNMRGGKSKSDKRR